MARCGTCGQITVAAPRRGPRERLVTVNAEIKQLEAALEKALALREQLEAALSDGAATNRPK